jgi:phosphate transport system substrate-binding protein
MLAIPGSNHGTREVFQEKVVTAGCEEAGLPEGSPEDACTKTYRQDVVVEIAGDYTETLARLTANPDTVGVFGLSFYDQNKRQPEGRHRQRRDPEPRDRRRG